LGYKVTSNLSDIIEDKLKKYSRTMLMGPMLNRNTIYAVMEGVNLRRGVTIVVVTNVTFACSTQQQRQGIITMAKN
jgi:hypothetical protein